MKNDEPIEEWGDIFADMTLSSAIIDRVMHHRTFIKINGKRPKLQDKKLKRKEGIILLNNFLAQVWNFLCRKVWNFS